MKDELQWELLSDEEVRQTGNELLAGASAIAAEVAAQGIGYTQRGSANV